MDQECRTCLDSSQSSDKKSIYDLIDVNIVNVNGSAVEQKQINHVLAKLMPELPEIALNDKLSKQICLECVKKLIELYEFTNCCLRSDLHTRQQIENESNANDIDIAIKQEIFEEDSTVSFADGVDGKQPLTAPVEANDSNITTDEGHAKDIKPIIKEEIFEDQPQAVASIVDKQDDEEENAENQGSKSVWRCGNCSKEFVLRRAFIKHLELNSSDGCVKKKQERLKCFFCKSTFASKESLQKHMKKIHNIDTQKKISPAKEHKCSRCLAGFISNGELQNHMLQDHRENLAATYSSTSKNVTLTTPTSPHIEEVPNKFTVKFLDEDDKTSIVNINMTEEELNKAYIQQLIEESYYQKGKHKKRFKCDICLKELMDISRLTKHLLERHSVDVRNLEKVPLENDRFKGLTILTCDICGDEFDKFSALVIHKTIHTHRCKRCDKGFSSTDCLRVHMRTHNKSKNRKRKTKHLKKRSLLDIKKPNKLIKSETALTT